MTEKNQEIGNDLGILGCDEASHYWRFKRYQELIKGKIKSSDEILDVGCGDGRLISFLPKSNKKVGVDWNGGLLPEFQKRNPEAVFIQASAEALPFAENTFDWVMCTEVIEHLKGPEQCLAEAKRVLKKGGYFLVSTYNHFNSFNLLTGRAFSKKPRFPDVHVREYNWLTFPKLIGKYFRIVLKTQAASGKWLEKFIRISGLPIGDFMIILAKNS